MASPPSCAEHPVIGPQAAVSGPPCDILDALSRAEALLTTARSTDVSALGDRQHGAALELLDGLRRGLERLTVAVVTDAVTRGPSATGGASSLSDWIRAHSPSMAQAEVNQVVTVVRAGAHPRNQALHASLLQGEVPVRRAARLAHALDQIRPFVDSESYDRYQRIVLPFAEAGGGSDKELTQACLHLVGTVSPPRDTENLAAVQRAARDFFERRTAGGMVDMVLRLDPEGAAVVRAVTTSLAAKPCPDGGSPDLRTAGHRKADAILTLLKRGMAAPDSIHTNGAVKVVARVQLSALSRLGLGMTSTGEQLSPGQMRRLACEADLIPAVYGTESELLDLGRSARLATAAQHLALGLRDKGCTIPSCSMPPQFCIAHHLRWWSRGGTTDLDNLALLCEHHHSEVHARDRTAKVSLAGVSWDP